MPSGFMALDQAFPRFTGDMTVEQRLQAMSDYLMQLLQELRYTLYNIGEQNFTSADWDKTSNEKLEEALAEEGGAAVDGGNITGTIDAHKVRIENLNASNLRYGEVRHVPIRGVGIYSPTIYGGEIHNAAGTDEDVWAELSCETTGGATRWSLDIQKGAQTPERIFRIRDKSADEVDLTAKDMVFLTADATEGEVTAAGKWIFLQDILLPAGGRYPTRDEVQAMIDASLPPEEIE